MCARRCYDPGMAEERAPKPPDLAGELADFRGSGVESGQIYTELRFAGCHLDDATATEITFERVRLEKTKARGSRLMKLRLVDLQLSGCDLRGADFEGSDLSRVSFRDCDLREVRLVDADLGGTDFRGSRVEGLLVQPGRLAGAVIDPSQAVDFAGLAGLVVKAR